jgi:hypothetical protein
MGLEYTLGVAVILVIAAVFIWALSPGDRCKVCGAELGDWPGELCFRCHARSKH